MLGPVKIAASNFFRLFGFGIRGSKSGFAFGIQDLDSESLYNFVSSSGHRPTWRYETKWHLGLSCHMRQNNQCLKRKNNDYNYDCLHENIVCH